MRPVAGGGAESGSRRAGSGRAGPAASGWLGKNTARREKRTGSDFFGTGSDPVPVRRDVMKKSRAAPRGAVRLAVNHEQSSLK